MIAITTKYHGPTNSRGPRKMGWKGKLVGGAVKDGYVFVFLDSTGKPLPRTYAPSVNR